MNIWNGEEKIIDDDGKNSTCQLALKERIPDKDEINRTVTIEEGRVINKPDDVDIIGKRTSKGFLIKGIELNTEKTKKCIICGQYKNIKDFWDNELQKYTDLCRECRENSYEDDERCTECWIR